MLTAQLQLDPALPQHCQGLTNSGCLKHSPMLLPYDSDMILKQKLQVQGAHGRAGTIEAAQSPADGWVAKKCAKRAQRAEHAERACASMPALASTAVVSARRVRLTPHTSARGQAAARKLVAARCAPTSEDEQAVSMLTLGPCAAQHTKQQRVVRQNAPSGALTEPACPDQQAPPHEGRNPGMSTAACFQTCGCVGTPPYCMVQGAKPAQGASYRLQGGHARCGAAP